MSEQLNRQQHSESLEEALVDLYLSVKIRSNEEVSESSAR